MCTRIIVDNNVVNRQHFLSPDEGSSGHMIRTRLERGELVIAYSEASADWNRLQNPDYRQFMRSLRERGRETYRVPPEALADAEARLAKLQPESNDLDLLAVALASDAAVLYSEDKKFRTDFRNTAVLPRLKPARGLYPHKQATEAARKRREEFLDKHKCPRS